MPEKAKKSLAEILTATLSTKYGGKLRKPLCLSRQDAMRIAASLNSDAVYNDLIGAVPIEGSLVDGKIVWHRMFFLFANSDILEYNNNQGIKRHCTATQTLAQMHAT